MSLRSLTFNAFYNSKTNDLISEFYIPAFQEAKEYRRVSAFFDANILSMYSSGIENIVSSNGHISFIFSSEIKFDDFEEMKKGYEMRKELQNKLLASVTTDSPSNELSNLAYLIANGYVDIKIAFTKSGILHDKFGLFISGDDCLYFRGSNNETVAAITSNFESFETTCSWDCDLKEKQKIENAINEFNDLWNDNYPETIVVDIPDVVKDKIVSYSQGKLILNIDNKTNTFIFDLNENNQLVGLNKLNDKTLLTSASVWYDGYVSYYVINNPEQDDYIYYFLPDLSYLKIRYIINLLTSKGNDKGFDVYVTPRLRKFLFDSDIQAEKRRSLGIAIKRRDPLVLESFNEFSTKVNNLMERKLREPQMWDAFHIVKMIRSANFSVPGAGKTSIVYGAFAYLLDKKIIDKIVMIGPINSFLAWKNEFVANFGKKLELNVFDYHSTHFSNAQERFDGISSLGKTSNLVLVNYESVSQNIDALKEIIDDKTLLVFDEVHRIKSIAGKWASAALEVSKKARYKVVLTGTPIPNGFRDIFNFLHILFPDEYDILFNYDESFLDSANKDEAKSSELNRALMPFFCRTTKKDLNVPPPEEDDLETGRCTFDQDYEKLLEIIYTRCGFNILLLYIRLLQASTNPSLILKKISNDDLKTFNKEEDSDEFEKLFNVCSEQEEYTLAEKQYITSFGMTEKFYKTVQLAKDLSNKGNQVVVWGIFVDNIDALKGKLLEYGINAEVIYGRTPLNEREEIIKKFINKEISVLITNPHTLAESVSLHKNCHHAIYMEYDFNLVHMLQSRDRIHRLGLEMGDKTYYHYMMMDNDNTIFNTIDSKIYYRLKEKEEIQRNAVESEDLTYIPDSFEKDIADLLEK